MLAAIQAGLGTVVEALLAKGVKYTSDDVSRKVLNMTTLFLLLFISCWHQ